MSNWAGIIGKGFRPEEFESYVATLTKPDWASFIVVHNTSEPRLSEWHSHPGDERMRNLESYYRDDQHWHAGPHLFIADDLIWVFTPLTVPGVHSPSWNNEALGIEMVGEYEEEPFSPAVRDNTVAALAVLTRWLGVAPDSLRFHKENPKTTHKECPGKNVDKSDLIQRVRDHLASGPAPKPLEHQPANNALAIGATLAAGNGGAGEQAPSDVPQPEVPQLLSTLLSGDPVLEAVAAGHTVLSPTSQRQDGVGAVQDALNQLGFSVDLGPDGRFRGFFGEKTEAALVAFQNSQGIDADGEVRQATILALDHALLAPPAPRAPTSGLPKRLPDYASQKLSAAAGVPWDKAQAEPDFNAYSGVLSDSVCHFTELARMPSPGVTGAVIYECKFTIDSDGVAGAGDIDHQGQTSLRNADGGSLNASQDPFAVIPLDAQEAEKEGLHKRDGLPDFSSLGVRLGDVGIAFWKDGESVFTVGDKGPPNNLGEGSIKMAQNLGIPANPSNGGFNEADVREMKKGVVHIVFPGSTDLFIDDRGRRCTNRTRDQIETLARQLYAAFRSQPT